MVERHIIGMNTSVGDGIPKKGLLALSQLIDLTSYQQMEFYNAASFKNTDTLDVHVTLTKRHPGGVFGSSEGGMVPYTTDDYFEKYTHLTKKRFAFKITDEFKIRKDVGFQTESAINRAAESFALQRDLDILNNIRTGYGVTKDAAAKWDAAGADVLGDLGGLFDELFNKEEVSVKEDDINKMIIYYPLKLYSQIREPVRLTSATSQVASRIQVNTSDLEWSGDTYGVTWVGTTKLNYLADAYAVIPTPDKTLNHYTYSGPDVPGVERGRDMFSGADMVVYSKYFDSMVIPESEDQLTSNYRIMRIHTVCDASTATTD